MFIKPFKIKTNTAIRGSDRRKIRAQITNQFPRLSAEQVSELIPNKDEMTVMKLQTHSGNNVTAYIVNGEPLFFEVEKQLFPTVYSLWKHPNMVPVFYTWPPVFENIRGGADLMLPGVILSDEERRYLGEFEKGAVCCVSLKGNRAPVAVGTTLVSRRDLDAEERLRGKGVLIVHSYLDQLWLQGTKTHPPHLLPLASVPLGDETAATVEEHLSEQLEDNVTLSEKENGDSKEHVDDEERGEKHEILMDQEVTHEGVDTSTDDLEHNDQHDDDQEITEGITECSAQEEDSHEHMEDAQMFESMDDLLIHCFLRGVLSAKKVELPILTSTFSRTFLLPSCPDGQNLDIKKSTYKKLSKFLQAMMERGFLKVAEVSKGVDHITELRLDHPELIDFKRTHRDDPVPVVKQVENTAEEERQPPEIVELLSVSGGAWNSLRPVLESAGLSKGSVVSGSDIRNAVTAYVKTNNLVDENDKRRVVLDPLLSQAFKVKGQNDVDVLSWDQLFTRVINMMNHCYQLTLPGYEPIVRKGKIEPIDIQTQTRTGNKKVTLVKNLEVYGIDPAEFAHKLQVKVAGSTSVSQLPGKKLPVMMQVMIQGNQVQHVGTALIDDYKIPKKYITGLLKGKEGGKKKK